MAELLAATQLVFAALMFVVAAWILGLAPASRIHRAFALFLAVRGFVTAMNWIGIFSDTLGEAGNRAAVYGLIAVPFAIAWFVLVYAFRPRPPPRYAALVIFLPLLSILSLQLASPCLGRCGDTYGLLWAFAGLVPLAEVLGAFVLFRQVEAERPAMSEVLVASGVLLTGLLDASFNLVAFAKGAWGPAASSLWLAVNNIAGTSAFVLGAFLVVRTVPRLVAGRFWMPVVAAAMTATGVAVTLPVVTGVWHDLSLFLVGLWRLVLPAFVGYALVRHRLFGVDDAIRWTISRGTVAGLFLLIVFSAAQVAENLIDETFGAIVGGVVTAGLLFAFAPLERLTKKIGHALTPGGKPLASLNQKERLALYRDQARLVWADGMMGRKERHLLDHLRERLGLSAEEGSRIEHEAMR